MKYKKNHKRPSLRKASIAALAVSMSITGVISVSSPVFAGDEVPVSGESVSGYVEGSSGLDEKGVETDGVTSSDGDHTSVTEDTSEKNGTGPDTVEQSVSPDPEDNVSAGTEDADNGSESASNYYLTDQDSKANPESSMSPSGVHATKNAEDSKAEASKAANGWKLVSGKWYYYKNNSKYTGWHYMTSAEGEKKDHWSYFGKDGALRTGWVQMGKGTAEPDGNSAKHWSYFGDNGWLRQGWIQLGKGTAEPDGNSAKHWSYFGDNGWLRQGWVYLGKGTSNPDGNSSPHWSYFGDNGWLRTGWVHLGKGTSDPDGNSAPHWSYFGSNGWLRTFWQQLGQGTENPDGNAPAHYSYFGSNGWLVIGTRTIDGKSYTFDNRGWLLQGSLNLPEAKKDAGEAGSTATQLIADGCYRISPVKNTNYSIDVYGENAADNTKIESYANNSSSAQIFQIKHLGNNIYSIKTGSSIYASGWDISGGKAVAGASVVQKKYTGASTQKWKIVSAADGSYTIKPAGSDLAIDIEGGKLQEGAVKLAKNTGSNTQRFKISKTSGFLFRNGRKYYFNKNGDKPMIGMDVSAWSQNVDWEKAKADGIEFAIIRTAHRLDQIDPYGARNMSECTRLGIPFGVYCYSYATTNAEADHEVDVLLSTLKGYNPRLGVFIDIEDNDIYQAAFGNIYSDYARRKITDIAKRMVNRVQNAGYLAGIYGNEIYLNNILYLNEMPNVRWVARYHNNNASDRNVIDLEGKGYNIWQFTSKGTVNGLPNSGWADLNTVIEKYW